MAGTKRQLLSILILGTALALGVASRASAQSASELDVAGFRTFVTWPDNAEVLERGSAVVSIAVAHWRWALGRGTGLPSLFGAVGVGRRVQVGASFERDASTYTDGLKQTSLGDAYIIGKVTLVDPGTHRIGVAVSPLLQILGRESLTYYQYYKSADTGRVQWGLPVHVQIPLGRLKASASAGYFSIGSSFVSGTLEAPVNERVVLTGTISQSYSTETNALFDAADVSRRRADVSGGAWYVVSPAAFLFGTIGRTISSADQNSMTLIVNFGVALFFGQR